MAECQQQQQQQQSDLLDCILRIAVKKNKTSSVYAMAAMLWQSVNITGFTYNMGNNPL